MAAQAGEHAVASGRWPRSSLACEAPASSAVRVGLAPAQRASPSRVASSGGTVGAASDFHAPAFCWQENPAGQVLHTAPLLVLVRRPWREGLW